jgi:hypothetical protein
LFDCGQDWKNRKTMTKNTTSKILLLSEVRNLTDQNKLAEIAQEVEDWEVGSTAVEKIFDQSLLTEIAKIACNVSVQKLAVEKLTDQEMLIKIAKSEMAGVRMVAIRNPNFTDQAMLIEIANKDENYDVRGIAVRKILDQQILAEYAKSNNNWSVRSSAISILTNQALLAEIAKTDKDAYIRAVAVSNPNFNDLGIITEIAKSDSDWKVRQVAGSRIIQGHVWCSRCAEWVCVEKESNWTDGYEYKRENCAKCGLNFWFD